MLFPKQFTKVVRSFGTSLSAKMVQYLNKCIKSCSKKSKVKNEVTGTEKRFFFVNYAFLGHVT